MNTPERNRTGRPRRFSTPEEMQSEIDKYFEYTDKNPLYKSDFIKSGDNAGQIIDIPIKTPYTLEGLCLFININTSIWHKYEKEEEYKEFKEVITYARDRIRGQQIGGGVAGVYDSNLVARINNLRERSDITSDEKPIQTTQINFKTE